MISESTITKEDFVHACKFGLEDSSQNLRMYLAKKVRSTKKTDPELAKELESLLKAKGNTPRVLRKSTTPKVSPNEKVNVDTSELAIKTYEAGSKVVSPIFSETVKEQLDSIISEKLNRELLLQQGLMPSSSAMMVGPPGVGKTIAAKWLSNQLDIPLYILDLSLVMSSLLGGSGANLRKVLDFARSHECILFIDEIDAIAKKRSDGSDLGELKRLVTVILQEIENWNYDSILLSATNHPELIDRAIWRRFDQIITFNKPTETEVKIAVHKFLGQDENNFSKWIPILSNLFIGHSFSDIERAILKIRKASILLRNTDIAMERFFHQYGFLDDKQKRIDLAIKLVQQAGISQHKANKITGVSRDTIRKKMKFQ